MEKRLLEIRALKKSKKPVFLAQDSHRRKEVVQNSWRRPKGIHSKTRLHHGGNPKLPSQGYRSPKAVRGLHNSGLKHALVSSIKQLELIKEEAIIISSSIGMKKRLEIIEAASAKKIAILNIDAKSFIKMASEKLSARKNKRKAASAKPEQAAKKPAEAEASPKDSKEESEEEKRKASKKEMEKIITKRE